MHFCSITKLGELSLKKVNKVNPTKPHRPVLTRNWWSALPTSVFNPYRICKQDVRPLEVKAKMSSFITVFKGYHLSVFNSLSFI